MILGAMASLPVAAGPPGGGTPWTPANITTVLWLSSKDASTLTLSGSNVTQWRDKSGNTNHMNPTGTLPTYTGEAGGVVISAATILGTIAAASFDAIIAVMQNGDGTLATFANYDVVFNGGNFDRILGRISDDEWHDFKVSTRDSFVNGAAANTRVVMPMAKSIQRFAFTARASAVATILSNSGGNEGWNGPVWEYIIPAAGTSAADLTRLEGYLAWENGTVATLDAGHLYKSAAPTV